jgi:protein-S-isoprenylcysteine O-methyltransferase Ste14
MSPTRLPDLGRRGEGWFAIQVGLLVLVLLAGLLAADAWSGVAAQVGWLAGLLLLAAGGGLAAWGLAGLGLGLSPLPRPRDGAELVESGAYGLVRHPVYGGLIIGSVGFGLLTASLLALLLAALLAAFLDLKARREEAWLRDHYAGYAAYMAGTRRLIPWLY